MLQKLGIFSGVDVGTSSLHIVKFQASQIVHIASLPDVICVEQPERVLEIL